MRPWQRITLALAFLLASCPLQAGGMEETAPVLKGKLLCSRLTDDTWQIWQIQLETGKRLQLTNSPGDKRYPAWGPNRRVIYHATQHACYLVEDNTPGKPVLEELWPVGDVAYSPDGSRMAFSKYETGLVDSANLWVSGVLEGEPKILTHDAGLEYNAAWSPDSKWIAYVGSNGYATAEIYLLDPEGNGRLQLTHNRSRDLLPAWSPDGSEIAYVSDATGDYEIWVMRADGSEPKQLTHSPGLDTRPAWAPDGKQIAFTSNRSGVLEIWVMNADGTDQRLVEHADGGVCDPAWS